MTEKEIKKLLSSDIDDMQPLELVPHYKDTCDMCGVKIKGQKLYNRYVGGIETYICENCKTIMDW